MYQASASGGVLAATGFAVTQTALAGWVILVAGLALLTILPRWRKRLKKH